MTIVKKEKGKDGVMIYTVKADLTDEQTEAMNGKILTNRAFKDVIDHDADVYTVDGKLLLRFRKNVLPKENIQSFYDAVIDFAHNKTATRGASSGSNVKDVKYNKPIKSNIYGYFDQWTLFHKHIFKVLKMKPFSPVRVSRFTTEWPEKFKQCFPLIKNIDDMYKKLVPSSYKFQRSCADQTAFRIPDTAFTTFTTNISNQIGCHKDSGNLKESFGNLVVIEKGKYEGCFTGYPQYKVAVDVRMCDFVAMNIHQIHSNSPLRLKSDDAERLSIVCYLRQGVYENSKGTTEDDVTKNLRTMKRILKRYNKKIHSQKAEE